MFTKLLLLPHHAFFRSGTLLALVFLTSSTALGQTGTASISGTLAEVRTNKPLPASLILAVSNTAPISRSTKSEADGSFLIRNLPPGKYALCVQVQDDTYLDPCRWDSPATLTLAAGQSVSGVALRITAASVIHILVNDPQRVLAQNTRDGRRPDLTLGVWGPKGMYYPARSLTPSAHPGNTPDLLTYQLAVPRDTALKLHISSHDLKLGNGSGVVLPGNASQEAFQHASGDANPKTFAFTVLGLLP